MTASDIFRNPGGDDGFGNGQHETPNEEYDDEGNVTKVENLEFIPGILGQGSFGTVRLARRRSPSSGSFHRRCSMESGRGSDDGDNDDCPYGRGTPRALHHEASPVIQFRSRRYSYDEPGESGAGRYTAYKNNLMATARGFGLFRSKSFADRKDDHGNDQLVAVKIFSKSNLKRRRTIERDKTTNRVKVKTALQQVEREIALMKKLSHPNLVRLYEVIDSPETDILYMVLEFMPLGEILTFLEDDGTFKRSESLRNRQIAGLVDDGHFDEEHAALYIVDILHGLAYLHQHHICHRDLKPENILLSDRGIAKVGDFGVSRIFEEENSESGSRQFLASIDEDHSQKRLSGADGGSETTTPIWLPTEEAEENPFFLTRHDTESAYAMGRMAGSGILTKTEGTWCFWSPEMCSDSDSTGFSGYAADMWAVGVCLYIFVTGKLPFYNKAPLDLFEMIAKCDVEYSGLGLSDPLIDLLKCCLEKDPNKRAGVGDCLHNPFLQNAREQRIRELGPEFEISKSTILHISEEDIRMAFRTVTSVPVQVLRTAGKKLSEGLAHTRENLRARIPSFSSTATSGDAESSDSNKPINEKSDGNIEPKTIISVTNKKQSNHVVFFSRQISVDSGQSETENHAYQLTLQKNENGSETDTHLSRLSSGISFGSTNTDDLHPRDLSPHVSFASNNADDLPLPIILSEEDGNRASVDEDDDDGDNDDNRNHNHGHNPSLDADCGCLDQEQRSANESLDDQEPLSQNSEIDKPHEHPLATLSTYGSEIEQERITENPSRCLIQ
jgi:[calcium/calmodulin-dependent protein kinase] kinase